MLHQAVRKSILLVALVAMALATSSAQAHLFHHRGGGCGYGGGYGGYGGGGYGYGYPYYGGYYGGWRGWAGGGSPWGGISYGGPFWGWYSPGNYFPVSWGAMDVPYSGMERVISPAPVKAVPATNKGVLNVAVPEDAVVFINDAPTTSKGKERQFVSKGLQPGMMYSYVVRVEAMRSGNQVSEVREIPLVAGQTADLAFTLADQETKLVAQSPPNTTLVVKLPADAQLYLGGNKTATSGPVRKFTTSALPSGEQWNEYTVRAVVERGGKQLEAKQTVSLKAGESRELILDFGPGTQTAAVQSGTR